MRVARETQTHLKASEADQGRCGRAGRELERRFRPAEEIERGERELRVGHSLQTGGVADDPSPATVSASLNLLRRLEFQSFDLLRLSTDSQVATRRLHFPSLRHYSEKLVSCESFLNKVVRLSHKGP